jgi:hypothetical protein
MTDPFAFLDLIAAQRIRADAQELNIWQATLALMDVLDADTLARAHYSANLYLQGITILGQPGNELNEQARTYFESVVERRSTESRA